MSRNCFTRSWSALVLPIVAVLLFAAGSVHASVYTGLLVDRGLPTFGVNAVNGSGGVDWTKRSNIGDGDFDQQDPIWAANPSWGPPEIPSDDFTLPVGNLGTADPNFHITDIRIWIQPNSNTDTFSQEFNSIGLMLGPKNGTLTNLNITPTVTTVHYPNGQSPNDILWQLDFAVNLTGTSGQAFSYAIVPNAKPDPNAGITLPGNSNTGSSGNGESYYLAFEEAVMQFAQTGVNPSGDGYVGDYFLNGTSCDSYTFPNAWGGVQAGDFAVQVFGTHTGTTYTWTPHVLDSTGKAVGTPAGGTFNWNNTPTAFSISGTNYTTTGDNWGTGVGGAYPNAIDDVATFTYTANTNVDLTGGAYTIGTLNLSGGMWCYSAHISDGTLIFQASGGNAALNDSTSFGMDDIQSSVTLSSTLTLNMSIYDYNGTGGYSQYYPASGFYAGTRISGAIGGAGGIVKTGPGMAWISNPGNTFSGNIAIQEGYLEFASYYYNGTSWVTPATGIPELGNTTKMITLGGTGTVGHLVIADNTNVLTNPIILTGAGGGLDADWYVFQLNNVISGTGNLMVGAGNWVQFNNTSDNTYVGDTKINGMAKVNTGVTARVFNGNIAVQGCGQLDLVNANNTDSTKSIMVGSFNLGSPSASMLATLGLGGDFMPTLDPNSSGVIQINCTTGANINTALAATAPQLGNGYMYIGGNGGTFTGTSLQPDLNHVYELRPAAGTSFALNNGPLQDVGGVATSVEVSTNIGWGQSGVAVAGTNNFTGALTVDASCWYLGYPQGGGSFGLNSALGPVNLNGGELILFSYGNYALTTKGTLTLEGQAGIGSNTFGAFGDNTNKTLMSFTSIVRKDNATLLFDGGAWGCQGAILGNNFQVTDTTVGDPATTNYNNGTMTAPWIVQRIATAANVWTTGFTVYDAVKGFMPATFTATDSFGANNGTDIVNLTAASTTVPAGAKVWALRTAGALTGGDITIGSGGLILERAGGTYPGGTDFTHTTNINFGSAEGVMFATDAWVGINRGTDIFTGTISGTGGLTLGGGYYGNGNHFYVFTADNSATLFGTITINQSAVQITNAGALGAPTNTIVLNGGSGYDGNSVVGSLGGYNVGWTPIVLNNPLVMGPNGGTITAGPYGGALFTLNGQITGSGSLTVNGGGGNSTITNGTNNWTGGTYLEGGSLTISSTGTLGPGPVVIGGGTGAALILQGNNNMDPNTRVSIWHNAQFLDTDRLEVDTSSATIGSLEGNGRVFFNINNVRSTLTMGQNGLSTDFYGNISDSTNGGANAGNCVGTLVKTGTGTFTLWGETALAGSIQVNNGTFANNGKIAASGVTVNSGGTLAGTGLVNPGVNVNTGGTVSGSLTLAGGLNLYGGAANFSGATVNEFYMSSGTYAGVSTINDANQWGIEIDGGTFGGTSTVNSLGNGYLYITGGTFGGVNTINTPAVWLDGGTFSSGGAVNITSGWGGGVYAGPGFYINGDGGGSGVVSGNAAINGNIFVWGGTFGGNHTIVGNVDVRDYWGGGTHPVFAGASNITGNVTVGLNGTFKGGHTVNGNLTTAAGSGATIAPSNTTASAETLTVVGNVALDHSTALNFNLGQVGTTGSGVNDLITITGNLSLDGTLNVNALTNFGPGTYTLITYTGTLTEPNGNLTMGAVPAGGYTYTFSNGTTGSLNDLNVTVATPWQLGDTNHDGAVNSLDIDAIYKHFGAADTSQWKVATDGLPVGQQDVTYELHAIFHTNYADANLDRKTDFVDFQVLLDHWQASGPSIGWAQGDFDGSGTVDFLDFQKLLDYWNPGGWNFAPAQAPEPATLSLLILGGLALLRRRK